MTVCHQDWLGDFSDGFESDTPAPVYNHSCNTTNYEEFPDFGDDEETFLLELPTADPPP